MAAFAGTPAVFACPEFSGVPTASDEMQPQYFGRDDIPFGKMWADDPLWYPLLLAGKLFVGVFHFRDTHTLIRHDLQEVSNLPDPPAVRTG